MGAHTVSRLVGGVALTILGVVGAHTTPGAAAGGARPTSGGPLLRTLTLNASFTAGAFDQQRDQVILYGSDRMGWRVWTLKADLSGRVQLVSVQTPGGLAADTPQGHLFVPSDRSTRVAMLDARTGTGLHTTTIGAWPPGVSYLTWRPMAVCARCGRVFAATGYGGTPDPRAGIGVLDATTGRALRTVPVGHTLAQMVVDERTARLFALNARDATVSVLDARTGTPLRTIPVGRNPLAVAVDARAERVFVTSNAFPSGTGGAPGRIDVLDARTGAVVATTLVGSSPGAVAVDERRGRAFVVNSVSNTVSMLDTRTGTVLRTTHVGQTPVGIAVDERRDAVLVTNANSAQVRPFGPPWLLTDLRGAGSVSVIDARSGAVRRTIAVGLAPVAVVVDGQRGHAFVLNAGAGGPSAPHSTRYTPGSITVIRTDLFT